MSSDYYRNRCLWITGASSGIGAACAREFVARGGRVAVSARNREALECLADELGRARVLPVPLDVTSLRENARAVERIITEFGGIDTAVFNAGTWKPTELDHWDSADFEAQMAVNFLGVVKGIEAVLPVLRKSSRGHLVGMSSAVAFRGIPRAEAYCATKSAVRAMLQALRCQLRPHGIPVTILMPGFVRSPLTDTNDFPMPFLMETEEAARRIADGVARQRNEVRFPKPFITGLRLLSLLPDSLYTRLMTARIVHS